MCRRLSLIPVGSLFLASLLALSGPRRCCAADADSDPQLREIAEALGQWRENLVSLYLRCEWTFDRGLLDSQDPSAPPPGTELRMELEWAWTDQGQVRYHRIDSANDRIGHRQLWTIDGDRSYTLYFGNDPSDPTRPVHLTVKPAPRGSSLVIEPLYGLWFPNRQKWLSEYVAEGHARLTGHSTIDETQCPIIKVERAPGIFVTLTLDPRHDYLPLKLVAGSLEKNGSRHAVDEFRSLPPGVSVPWSGTLEEYAGGELYSRKRWRVLEAKVNAHLDKDLFAPPVADGTLINDAFSGREYRKGGKKPPALPANDPESAPAPENPATGVPQVSAWRYWATGFLVGAGLLFFATAWYVRRAAGA